MEPKNFYLFTGKGGVGKTILSLSFSHYLQRQGYKVIYTYFKQSSLLKQDDIFDQGDAIARELGLEVLPLDLEESVEGYITQKMGSKLIAKGIVKAPFFRALINMIPGFNYLIYLGRILQEIKDAKDKGEKLIIVLDSPSSGHALTMLEATGNFQKIFQSGIIFDDTKKMLKMLSEKNFAQVEIVTIPTQLAMTEGHELSAEIKKLVGLEQKMLINNCYTLIDDIAQPGIPPFLQKKLANEKQVFCDEVSAIKLPFSLEQQTTSIVQDLLPHMENLV
jgi:anion-transporting  ArsA/GET3 family ATPase